MSAPAELLADGGAAASAPEFFRSPEFLAAEGATHSLLVGGGVRPLAVPLIVREIEGGGIDAVSPYGYPGGSIEGGSVDCSELDLAGSGLVSIFVRERVGPPAIAGGSERGTVLLHDPERPRNLRDTFAWEARRNERDGYSVQVVPGPEVEQSDLLAFNDLYEQTMRNAEAADRYFFGAEYLRGCLDFGRSWLVLSRDGDGELGSGAIAAVSDGILHYFLAGTADSHRAASPGKNGLVALLDLSDELGMPLNLGGGIKPGDGLEKFKRGFTNASEPFVTHELVADHAAYERLSEGREAGDFFPAYRAPS
ncbi:hypothetical protein BH10ACT11_BH10ACT11_21950 [soil metagenome]